MWKFAAIAVAVLGLTASAADALELKNVRSTYGPFGSVRPGNKFMSGDSIVLQYDIDGLQFDKDTNNVSYTATVEVFNAKKESIFKKATPVRLQVVLGGPTVTGYGGILLNDLKPGAYRAKITVVDKANDKSTSFDYAFEILPQEFGFVHPYLPAYWYLNGGEYAGQIAVVGMGRDAKKMANVDILVKILDEQGKPTLTKPWSLNVPRDIPEEYRDKDFFPVLIALTLTRTGTFRVQVEAIDRVSKKTAKLSFPLKVVDPSAVK